MWYVLQQERTWRCSTGRVGTEDSAGGSVMPRSTSLGIMVALEDTGTPSKTSSLFHKRWEESFHINEINVSHF